MPRYSGGGSCTPATSPLAAVKLEPDLSLDLKPDLEAMDQCPGIKVEAELELDNLQNLISTCDFSSVLEEDVLTATRGWPADQDHQPWKQEPAEPLRWKEEECQPHRRRQDPLNSIRWKEEIPEWKEEPLDPSGWKEGAGLASSLKAEEESTPSPLDRGISTPLTQEEMLSVMKLEMSFENSGSSFPVMSEETTMIWNCVVASCNFQFLKSSMTSSLLSEAVELCLKRNLILLQENPDFTSLAVETRTALYIQNMGSMCHVRGLMQRSSASLNFTCINKPNKLQISYRDVKTGRTRLWKVGGGGTSSGPGVVEQESGLLALAESIWALNLERSSFLILLLIVLFSSQGCDTDASHVIDRLQNKYLALLYR